jgi:hypothetical protein
MLERRVHLLGEGTERQHEIAIHRGQSRGDASRHCRRLTGPGSRPQRRAARETGSFRPISSHALHHDLFNRGPRHDTKIFVDIRTSS